MSLTSYGVDSLRVDPARAVRIPIGGVMAGPRLPCDPSELWSQLVDGNLRITDHFIAARRCYLVAGRRAAAEVVGARLTSRERDILTRTLCGAQQKVTALDLALAPSTVASHLAGALLKLEMPASTPAIPLALVLLCQSAGNDARPGDAHATLLQHLDIGHVIASRVIPEKRLRGLTAAEQDVADALVAGSTKLEIARARQTSVNTIGKQVSSLFANYLGCPAKPTTIGIRACRARPNPIQSYSSYSRALNLYDIPSSTRADCAIQYWPE